MNIGVERYEWSIEINKAYYKYTIKHERHGNAFIYGRLLSASEDLYLHAE